MQNIGQKRISSIKKIYVPLRVIFLFTWNKITLLFTDRCYSLKVDPILVFLSLLFRRSCDSSSVVHRIIIFFRPTCGEQDNRDRMSRGCPPRNYLISTRELVQELALSNRFFSHPISFARRFFLPPLAFSFSPFLAEKAFREPSATTRFTALAWLFENTGITAFALWKQRRQGRTQEFGRMSIERNHKITCAESQSWNLEKKARSSKLSRNDTIPKL